MLDLLSGGGTKRHLLMTAARETVVDADEVGVIEGLEKGIDCSHTPIVLAVVEILG